MIFDLHNGVDFSSAVIARTEQGKASDDASVNRAFDGLGTTRAFYNDVFDRNSIDDRGMRLDGYVHRGRAFNNAFWDGQEMVFGDGDGNLFADFTQSLDVIAHELTHGVTEHTAGLSYHDQPGALNESMSDVFGSLVKQWSLKQTADQADWLIGADVFTPGIPADALRSMKEPGKAYNNELMGKDPQPDHMSRFVHLPNTPESDNGGVHINSGIPNKAFYLAASGIGGSAWEGAGHIWYEALKASGSGTEFQEFAETTVAKAEQLYGNGSVEQQAVVAAWREVGIRMTPVSVGMASRRASPGREGWEADGLAALTKQIQVLDADVKRLTKELAAAKR
jgi:Zn-dependent metalloprotease